MEELLKGLNAAQTSAVTSQADVLQVLAPPGSGKTKTLTARVSHLITDRAYRPWNILVCTFTVKAAKEMKERITSVIGEDLSRKLILGTFHSVSRRFLATYGHYIGLHKGFGIADTSDTKAIIKRIIKDHGLTIEPGKALARISSNKAKKISAERFATTAKRKRGDEEEFVTVYSHYQAALELSNLLDYDDLLLKCEYLLRQHPECVANIEAVLIDEFQDTNEVQFDLMSLFAQHRRRITIVGDPDQSIYGWRNAEIENLNKMKRHYPDTVVIFLEENYRSSGAILNSAQTVIEQDSSRPDKRLQATHSYGEKPVLRRLPTADAEARWLVDEIKRSRTMTGGLLEHGDFAVLLRSAQLSRHIETALGNTGIPYRMVGGTKFYDRVEIKTLLDYLRVIDRPEHNDALLRVLNVPARNIGEVTVKKLLDEATLKQAPVWDLLLSSAQGRARPYAKISAQAEKGIADFVNVILSGRKKRGHSEAAGPTSPADLLDFLLKKLAYEKYLQKKYPDDHETRWANIEELKTQTADLNSSLPSSSSEDEEALPLIPDAEQISSNTSALSIFLSNIALSSAADTKEAPKSSVTISTIHAAKGLEWPVVFIPSCYEGSIPHSRAEDTDEERRLLYVGMTRAQAMLYLSVPLKNGATGETTLSSFLAADGVESMFAPRGPELEYAHVGKLAATLGRTCPSYEMVENGRKGVELWDDTYWPEDGSWPVEESSRWDRGVYGVGLATGGMKPMPLNVGKLGTVSTAGFGTAATFMSASKVTMQQAEEYSINKATLSVGFVSAASRLAEVDSRQDEANLSKLERRKKQTAATAANAERGVKRANSAAKHGGDIKVFFGGPKPAMYGASKEDTCGTTGTDIPLQPIGASVVNARPALSISEECTRSEAVIGLASTFTKHSLLSQPSLKRPIQRMDSGSGREAYVFLSSSPTRDVEEPDAKRGRPHGKVDILEEEAGQNGASRPAATFHATSLASLQTSRPAAGRRTLGMKGPLKPWSARGTR